MTSGTSDECIRLKKKKEKKKSWALLLRLRKTNKNKYKLNLQNNLVFNVWNSTERKSQTTAMTNRRDSSWHFH